MPRRGTIVALGSVLAALVLSAAAGSAASGSLYAGPTSDPSFGVIAPELLTAMFPEQRLDLIPVDSGEAAVDRVAEQPNSAAIADLASMLDYAARKQVPEDRLEFHGPLSQRCFLAFARKGGWITAFADVVTAAESPRPVIGIAGSDPNNLVPILRRIEPGLEKVEFQTGTETDLVPRLARGSLDLLLIVAYPAFDRETIERLADDERMIVLPVITRVLFHTALERDRGFTLSQVRFGSRFLPWTRRPTTTLCLPVGVVLRNDAPPALRDAVNRAIGTVADTLRVSLADRAKAAAQSVLHDVVGAVKGLLDQW